MSKSDELLFRQRYGQFVRSYAEIQNQLRTTLAEEEALSLVDDWVWSTDTLFPKILFGRTLRAILNFSAFQIYCMYGVGIEHAKGVLRVLQAIPARRLLRSQGKPETPPALTSVENPDAPEIWWSDACTSIRAHGLEHEPLGRFCRNLVDLPKTMWEQTLVTYAIPLAELRQWRTVGVVRLGAILETFHCYAGFCRQSHLIPI